MNFVGTVRTRVGSLEGQSARITSVIVVLLVLTVLVMFSHLIFLTTIRKCLSTSPECERCVTWLKTGVNFDPMHGVLTDD
jgi:hypothetical protein